MGEYISIFNNVLSPVCPGPSAGCTGGSSHLGRVGRQLLGERPAKLVAEMSPKGGFPSMLSGMRNDVGLIHGMLGRELTDPRFLDAFEDAKKEGLEYSFVYVDDIPAIPITFWRIRLTGAETGRELVYECDSIGGGMIVLFTINGCPVKCRGIDHEAFLFCGKMDQVAQEKTRAAIEASCSTLNEVFYGEGPDRAVWDIKSSEAFSEDTLAVFRTLPGVTEMSVLAPEQVVVNGKGGEPPFQTPDEMVTYVTEHGMSLAEAAVEYESAVSGWTKDEVRAYAGKLWDIIDTSIEHGEESGFDLGGVVPSRIKELMAAMKEGNTMHLGAADESVIAALAIMEHSSGSGIIVGAPTGGSAALMPATIYGACKAQGKGRDEMINALLVAGLMGVFMAEVDFNGGFGCQEEIGCGAAMAAGAVVYLLGGTARQACDAASICLQCLLGLICNTLCGLVQIPCYIRNMAFTSVAMICANSAIAGMDCPIPLDEISHYMAETGKKMLECGVNPCDGNGTPTGCRIQQEFWGKK